jgi:hypothetical protein
VVAVSLKVSLCLIVVKEKGLFSTIMNNYAPKIGKHRKFNFLDIHNLTNFNHGYIENASILITTKNH